jgi:hypothetical protein
MLLSIARLSSSGISGGNKEADSSPRVQESDELNPLQEIFWRKRSTDGYPKEFYLIKNLFYRRSRGLYSVYLFGNPEFCVNERFSMFAGGVGYTDG